MTRTVSRRVDPKLVRMWHDTGKREHFSKFLNKLVFSENDRKRILEAYKV